MYCTVSSRSYGLYESQSCIVYFRLTALFDMLWGARGTSTVDPELKSPIAAPEPPECLLSVRRAPIVTKYFFIWDTCGRTRTSTACYIVLVPVRTAVPVLRRSSYNSVGTRIQCGGTLSPLPTGRDSLGIGGEVQWHGLTVFLGVDLGGL